MAGRVVMTPDYYTSCLTLQMWGEKYHSGRLDEVCSSAISDMALHIQQSVKSAGKSKPAPNHDLGYHLQKSTVVHINKTRVWET